MTEHTLEIDDTKISDSGIVGFAVLAVFGVMWFIFFFRTMSVRRDSKKKLMGACFARITDRRVLEAIAQDTAYNPTARRMAVEQFADESYLTDLAPAGVNQTWPMLGTEGIVWGIEELSAGETIVLTYGDAYMWPSRTTFDGVPAGDLLYVQVDSAKVGSEFGAVRERHEITGGPYNNIAQHTVPSTFGAPALPGAAIVDRYDLGSWPQRP